jgi:hypothetical protein
MHLQPARADARHVEQIVHQAHELLHLVLRHLHMVQGPLGQAAGSLRRQLPPQHLQLDAQRGERRLQLVAGHGEELIAGGYRRLGALQALAKPDGIHPQQPQRQPHARHHRSGEHRALQQPRRLLEERRQQAT